MRAGAVARGDFDRAAAAAKKPRRPEARTAARLGLAQNLPNAVASGEIEIDSRVRTRGKNVIGFN